MVMKVDFSSRLAEKNSSKGRNRPAKTRMQLAAENSPRAKFKSIFEKRKGLSPKTRKKLKKVFLTVLVIFCFITVIGGLWFFAYLQKLDAGIKSIDDIFRERELASVFLDRNGKELYKLFNNFNRDQLVLADVPPQVKWAYLASEDIDFYKHQGFDPIAIARCGVYNILARATKCGGSTITQQIVKIQTNQNQPSLDRKFQEILAAIKVEQAYSKEEILELYLQVAPFGSNIYGLTSASQFYFGKQPKDLTLAEGAILAGIIQNPTLYSPTLPPNPQEQQKRIKARQEDHVLNQLKVHKAYINDEYRRQIDDPEADDIITDEILEQAKAEALVYRPPVFTTKKAGHAVDYALEQLQKVNYKASTEPFTLTDLQNGGYKIYTTIDYDLQQIAEQSVFDAVNSYGKTYAYRNAALMTSQPSTGEIITMVGSRKYDEGNSEGCDANGRNCLFNPQVNILTSPQSPGSSTKPMGTYQAYAEGKVFPGSILPDVPINLGGGYTVKNWNSTFFGVGDSTTVGEMLRQSRNLPAITILEMIGIPKFLEVMRNFGYTTYKNDNQYGPSVILGGSDVLPIEHAQGYGVFANNGNLVKVEIIKKIVDREGNVVYEHKPEPKKVADERASYLLNQTLLNNHSLSWDGRNTAAKSGTSENSTDAWIVNWSPDYVTVAWVGNNNNKTMNLNAFGENAVAPWVKGYMRQIGDSEYFRAATAFPRPGGIVNVPGCSGECLGSNFGFNSGLRLGMEGVSYPADVVRKKVKVCSDQTNRLARPIDEALGKAQEVIVATYVMPAASYQGFLDTYLQDQANQNKGYPNGGPTQYCDIDRSGGGITGPFFQNISVTMTGANTIRYAGNIFTTTDNGNISNVDFYFDCNSSANCTNAKRLGFVDPEAGTFDSTFTLPNTVQPGTYQVMLRATDGVRTNYLGGAITVVVGAVPTATFGINPTGNITWTAGTTRAITYTLSAAMNLNAVQLFASANGAAATLVGNMADGAGNTYTINWNVADPGAGNTVNYTFYMTGAIAGTTTGRFTSPVSAQIAVTR